MDLIDLEELEMDLEGEIDDYNEEEEEEDEFLGFDLMFKHEVIYPRNINKYIGTVQYHLNGWRFKCVRYNKHASFNSYEEAINFKKEFAIEKGEVENIILDLGYYYEIKLIKSKHRVIVDKELYFLLDKYKLLAENTFKEVNAVIQSKELFYPRLSHFLLKDKLEENDTVIHLNKNSLDCRLSNLLIVSLDDYYTMLERKELNEKCIFPKNLSKYVGGITLCKGRYIVNITKYNIDKSFDSYEDAEKYKISKAKMLGEVKNIAYNKGDYYEISLNGVHRTKIDKEDLTLVDPYILAHDEGYVLIYINGAKYKLHNYLMHFTPTHELSIDHIDRNKSNNCKTNLRVVNRNVQVLNRNVQISNTSGVVGVYYHKKENAWNAAWTENNVRKSRSFGVNKYGANQAKQMAINKRKEMEEILPEYKYALTNTI